MNNTDAQAKRETLIERGIKPEHVNIITRLGTVLAGTLGVTDENADFGLLLYWYSPFHFKGEDWYQLWDDPGFTAFIHEHTLRTEEAPNV